MARVKRGVTTHARHKKVLEQTKGYRGRGKNVYTVAIERLENLLGYNHGPSRGGHGLTGMPNRLIQAISSL